MTREKAPVTSTIRWGISRVSIALPHRTSRFSHFPRAEVVRDERSAFKGGVSRPLVMRTP
ncbi:hypothetical protein [Lysobacter gummosus]